MKITWNVKETYTGMGICLHPDISYSVHDDYGFIQMGDGFADTKNIRAAFKQIKTYKNFQNNITLAKDKLYKSKAWKTVETAKAEIITFYQSLE